MNMYRYNVCRFLNKNYLAYFSSGGVKFDVANLQRMPRVVPMDSMSLSMVFHVILYYSVYFDVFLSPLVVDYYEEVVRAFPLYFYDRPSVK